MDPDPVFGKSGCNGRSKLCGDIHGSKGDLVKMPSQKAEYIIRIGMLIDIGIYILLREER